MQVEEKRKETKTEKQDKIMGPVDYLVVGFPGNRFSGEIVPEIVSLEEKGIIRVIDMVLVSKDENGKMAIIELEDLQNFVIANDSARAFEQIAGNTQKWFYEGDIETIASELPNNSSAGLLLYENVWAIKLKEALRNSGAELIDMGRIAPEVIAEAEKMMQSGGA